MKVMQGFNLYSSNFFHINCKEPSIKNTFTVGWVDIGTRTKVPLRYVTYLSKVTKINKKKWVDPVTASSLV
jgi:hypothetical protein